MWLVKRKWSNAYFSNYRAKTLVVPDAQPTFWHQQTMCIHDALLVSTADVLSLSFSFRAKQAKAAYVANSAAGKFGHTNNMGPELQFQVSTLHPCQHLLHVWIYVALRYTFRSSERDMNGLNIKSFTSLCQEVHLLHLDHKGPGQNIDKWWARRENGLCPC